MELRMDKDFYLEKLNESISNLIEIKKKLEDDEPVSNEDWKKVNSPFSDFLLNFHQYNNSLFKDGKCCSKKRGTKEECKECQYY